MIDETNGNLTFKHVNEEETELKNNKKSKWKFILGGILLVIAIGVGLYIGYNKIVSNPVVIYKNAINGVYNVLSENVEELKKKTVNIDVANEPVMASLNLKFDSNMKELKSFTGLDYSLKVGFDSKNKKGIVEAGIRKNNKEVVNLLAALLDNNLYLKSEKLFNKIVNLGKYDIEELNLDSYISINNNNLKINYEDIKYILKQFKDMVIDSLDKDKFELTDQVITIRNKKMDVKKALYKLDKENMDRTLKYITEEILKDEKMLLILANLSGEDKEDIKTSLKDVEYDGEDVEVVLYTNRLGAVIAGVLEIDKKEILEFDYLDKMLNATVKDDSNKLVISESNDAINVVYTEKVKEVLNLKFYKLEENKFKMDYAIESNGAIIDGTVELIDKNNNKSDSAAGDFKFNIGINDEKKIDFTVEGSYEISKAPVTFNATDSVKVEDISEAEMMNIYTKLSEVLNELGLTDIGNLITGM